MRYRRIALFLSCPHPPKKYLRISSFSGFIANFAVELWLILSRSLMDKTLILTNLVCSLVKNWGHLENWKSTASVVA